MKDIGYNFRGYRFLDIEEYREAKREAESIEYIRAKTNLKDLGKVTKLYHKLIDKQTFRTIIGHEFLKELQNTILEGGINTLENIPSISIGTRSSALHPKKNHNDKGVAEEYRIRHRNSRIINIFLTLIIIAMIIINLI
ncbi:MAG: hypothetical protein GX359_08430 [Clostridiales bacterium]|nr:hypothetical protein [Clostridiales bacterium]